jgi:hypothetical protein
MKYCQFKVNSTGYISGTTPPQFSKEHVKPIDMLGSDGVFRLDGRLNIHSMIVASKDRMEMLNRFRMGSIVGFDIIQANDFLEKGRILYSYHI